MAEAMGKFQFIEGSWGGSSKDPLSWYKNGIIGKEQYMAMLYESSLGEPIFDIVEELQHALVICLNSVYHGQATVATWEHIPTNSMTFKIKVSWEQITWHITHEGLHGNLGGIFEDILHDSLEKVDNSGAVMTYESVSIFNKKFDINEPITMTKIPVTGSYSKLLESGILHIMREALAKGCSVKMVNETDLSKMLDDFQRQMKKMEKSLHKMEYQAKLVEKNMEKLTKKFGNPSFAPGGFVAHGQTYLVPQGQNYHDSGELLAKQFPGIMEKANYPCGCQVLRATIHDIIIHLNDSDKHIKTPAWTREMIADWLETLDTKLELKEDS